MKLGLFVRALHDPQRDYIQLFFGLITGDRIRCGVFNSAAEVDTR